MLKNPRINLLIILILALLAVVITWPSVPVKFSFGLVKIDTVLKGPDIDFDSFGLNIRRDLDLKLGLDLSGGSRLILKADVQNIAEDQRETAVEAAKEVIERRINFFGVAEPIVQTSRAGEEYRIIVEMPGVTNVEEAKNLIGQTAKLEFREYIDPETPPGTIPTLENTQATGISGKDLKSASLDYQQAGSTSDPAAATSSPVVRFELTGEGAQKFGEVTSRLIGKPLVVFLDDRPISAPIVQSEIREEGIITGVTTEEARRLAIQLSAGALPVEKIEVISEKTIGPTLGKTSINKSLVAGLIGIIAVMIFMLFYYGMPGLIANFALFLYTLFILSIFKLVPVTLTLAGIAGFILSIGMAVDANILIFERIKEELTEGKNNRQAMNIGFTRAWSSIRDSNISSLLTAAILFWFGTGSVRGFALALGIGILVSMFTAIYITKNLLRVFYRV